MYTRQKSLWQMNTNKLTRHIFTCAGRCVFISAGTFSKGFLVKFVEHAYNIWHHFQNVLMPPSVIQLVVTFLELDLKFIIRNNFAQEVTNVNIFVPLCVGEFNGNLETH